ncbi:uncharacterized protein LOC116286233 isoform X2 [Actinia tenebrosa]|uniref:Uncharacterized protein LOC116286233 isoform X2 n=1 Tax=Actinia tenebrosa TaxID=6105 RepID=A0A6P8GYE8_ACTTE|nr:uncharacterized protein LOC116286233 isoform X2 [Actinia tenebrosa]
MTVQIDWKAVFEMVVKWLSPKILDELTLDNTKTFIKVRVLLEIAISELSFLDHFSHSWFLYTWFCTWYSDKSTQLKPAATTEIFYESNSPALGRGYLKLKSEAFEAVRTTQSKDRDHLKEGRD